MFANILRGVLRNCAVLKRPNLVGDFHIDLFDTIFGF